MVVLLLLGGVARADDTADAKRLFMSGTRHFDLTEYEAALNDYKEGYRKKDDPVFLYNIAQCAVAARPISARPPTNTRNTARTTRCPDAINRARRSLLAARAWRATARSAIVKQQRTRVGDR